MEFDLDFPFAQGRPAHAAKFKACNEDFIVYEQLGFEPVGEGEHVFLQIEKNGDNTGWIAAQLAAFAGVKTGDIGYAGLKDRHAVTRQWFSVYLPKPPEPDWSAFAAGSATLLAVARHTSKLRRGQHSGNAFTVVLHSDGGDDAKQDMEARLQVMALQGVPNYFGPQRFGHGGGNLALAEAWFSNGETIRNRQKRGLVMSAARSYLFNRLLAERVIDANWQQKLDGEPEPLASGPLWGRGRVASSGQTLVYEQALTGRFAAWCEQLEHLGLNQERRALCCLPEQLNWDWQDEQLRLSFTLPPGQYATSVVRELAAIEF